jgi:hypothetical protein
VRGGHEVGHVYDDNDWRPGDKERADDESEEEDD